MNTQKLVVGQSVWARCGYRTLEGKVVNVEPWMAAHMKEQSVAVELILDENHVRRLVVFDPNGKTGTGWDGLGLWEYIGGGWLQSDPRDPYCELVTTEDGN